MTVMSAEVSRALGQFITATGIGQVAARKLAAQYGDVASLDDLPEWLTEQVEIGPDPGTDQDTKRYDPHQLRDPHTGEWADTTP